MCDNCSIDSLSTETDGYLISAEAQEMATRVLKSISDFPANFDMDSWASDFVEATDQVEMCSTTMCVAGWAVHHAGYNILVKSGRYATEVTAHKDGNNIMNIELLGANLLGLRDADRLFYANKDCAKVILTIMAEEGRFPHHKEI